MAPATPDLVVLALVSLAPGFLWVWFFYRKDRAEPEPKALVAKAFLYGVLSVFPAAFLEAPFRRVITAGAQDLAALLVVSVLVVGVVEEVSKFVAVKVAAYDSAQFNEVMDGVVYAVAAGLGFAATENLFYATTYGLAVGIVRAFITDLAHASFSGIVGYYLGRAKFDAPHATALVARGLGTAITLHGGYDFLIMSGIVPPAFGVFMVLATYAYLSRKIVQARRLSPVRPPQTVAAAARPSHADAPGEAPPADRMRTEPHAGAATPARAPGMAPGQPGQEAPERSTPVETYEDEPGGEVSGPSEADGRVP